MTEFDAAVVGAGPNGLAAAVELARSGRKTLLVEAADEIGGGTRTASSRPDSKRRVLGDPPCRGSPFFTEIDLDVRG
jgi:flavin-dependent dehydrogenase